MNPFLINEPTCISFSGGRTSAYMLYRILEAHQMSLPKEAIVCFANTGKEEEATLKFVHDCEKNWGVEIHWLEYQNAEPSFKRVNFVTASILSAVGSFLSTNFLSGLAKKLCTAAP